MRLLIAGGGTGGHIYPALAVAESLRRRPNPPDLGWLGGQRGLEDRIVPQAGIPLRRLALRSLRTVERDVHLGNYAEVKASRIGARASGACVR